MRTFDEQKIVSMAPNANAVANGRKISSSGDFVKRMRSEDDSLYWGECKGSGKNNYIVSIDFEKVGEPVFRCSCPSRQFPCKHGIALMFEIKEGKNFQIEEIPQDIIDKRNKIEAREKKKEESKSDPERKKKTMGVSRAAKTKKIKTQIEGLNLLRDFTDQITALGLASCVNEAFDNKYDEFAKQLGDYYLPGVQLIFKRFLKYLRTAKNLDYINPGRQRNSEYFTEEHLLGKAVSQLIKLRYIEKRGKDYLTKKLESEAPDADDNILYEALGGVWKLEELDKIGLKKEGAVIAQLSFSSQLDSVKEEYTDKGYWIDLDIGEINYTANYCPIKAKKHIQRDDSFFGKKHIETLYFYPAADGENRRIRFEGGRNEELSTGDIAKIKSFAKKNIDGFLKSAKNILKATLSDNAYAVLFEFKKIGENEGKLIAEDNEGRQVLLKPVTDDNTVIDSLLSLPSTDYIHNQVLFGLAYYDEKLCQICMEPESIITDNEILRLAY